MYLTNLVHQLYKTHFSLQYKKLDLNLFSVLSRLTETHEIHVFVRTGARNINDKTNAAVKRKLICSMGYNGSINPYLSK